MKISTGTQANDSNDKIFVFLTFKKLVIQILRFCIFK